MSSSGVVAASWAVSEEHNGCSAIGWDTQSKFKIIVFLDKEMGATSVFVSAPYFDFSEFWPIESNLRQQFVFDPLTTDSSVSILVAPSIVMVDVTSDLLLNLKTKAAVSVHLEGLELGVVPLDGSSVAINSLIQTCN